MDKAVVMHIIRPGCYSRTASPTASLEVCPVLVSVVERRRTTAAPDQPGPPPPRSLATQYYHKSLIFRVGDSSPTWVISL